MKNDLDEGVDMREWDHRKRIFTRVVSQEVKEMSRRILWRKIPELPSVTNGYVNGLRSHGHAAMPIMEGGEGAAAFGK